MDTIKILEGIYQPHIVNAICKKLCEKGVLTGIKEEGGVCVPARIIDEIIDRTEI